MKLHEPQHRAPTPSPGTLSLCSEFTILWLLILMILGQPAGAQQLETATVTNRAPLTAEQVVQNLVQMNLFVSGHFALIREPELTGLNITDFQALEARKWS